MKKLIRISAIAALAAFLFTACHKEPQAVTKVINVSIKANETYNYSIPPTGDNDDKMDITRQAQHALSSTLAFTDNAHSSAFQYTPATDYTGGDEVHVATIEEHHGNHPQGGGSCSGHHHDESTTYIFKITIGGGNQPG